MKRKKINESATEVTIQGSKFLLRYVSQMVDSVLSRYGALSFVDDLNTILNRVAFEKSMQEQLDSMKDNEKKDKAKKVEIPQEEEGMSM